jgi:hypothetical protein
MIASRLQTGVRSLLHRRLYQGAWGRLQQAAREF